MGAWRLTKSFSEEMMYAMCSHVSARAGEG